MDKIEMMHELCEVLMRELEDANDKLRKSGGKLTSGDLEYIDKLAHAIKSIKTTKAMMESDEGGYSGYSRPMYTYADGRGSYARRGNNPTGRNQYSREGYSYADGMEELLTEMRDMMDDMPEDKRKEVERFISKMRRM